MMRSTIAVRKLPVRIMKNEIVSVTKPCRIAS